MTVWCWGSYYATREEPKVDETITALSLLIVKALEVGEEWGACHIVLSDINIERNHMEFCLAQPNLTLEGRAAMDGMLGSSCRTRAIALCAAEDGRWNSYTEDEWARTGWNDDEDLAVDFND